MIGRGANPFVVGSNGYTDFDYFKLGCLSNLPSQKSIYFTTSRLPDKFKEQNEFLDPWFYRTGVFDGKFG